MKAFVFLIIAVVCWGNAPFSAFAQPTTYKPAPILPKGLDPKKVIKDIYANCADVQYFAAQNTVRYLWNNPPIMQDDLQLFPPQKSADGYNYGWIDTALTFVTQTPESTLNILVLVGSLEYDTEQKEYNVSHAASPAISLGYYQKRLNDPNAEYKFISAQHAEISGGYGYGSMPKLELTKIGEDNFGITVHSGYMGQGTVVAGLDLYVQKAQEWKEVFHVLTAESNAGFYNAKDKQRFITYYSSDLSFIQNSTKFYDINVEVTGKLGESCKEYGQFMELYRALGNCYFHSTTLFRYDGERYVMLPDKQKSTKMKSIPPNFETDSQNKTTWKYVK